MNFNLINAVLILLLFSTTLWSQQRPLLTEDPRVLADGRIATELGFAYFHRARFPVSGLEGNQYSFLPNALHIGFGDRAQFQIGGVAHNFVQLRAPDSGWRNDWGDFFLSTKMMIVDENRFRPIVSFRPTIVLPNTNNQKGLGTDGTHFFADILVGKHAGPVFLFGSMGLGILDDAVRAAAQQDVLTFGIAGSLPVSSSMNLVAEWNGLNNPQSNPSPGGESRGQARFGLQWRKFGVRWDAGLTKGTTDVDHKAGVVVGFTRELQLWQ
jgi:hypothetical protein